MILFAAAMLLPLCAGAQETTRLYYGYTPQKPAPVDVTAFGTGMNNFVEGAICLNPANDPLLERLQGSKVVGVRCFMRAEYKQKSKRYTSIWTRRGSLKETPEQTYVNFAEGWNELLFDEPVELDSQPLYVGVKAFEMKGTPYPLVAYAKASVNDGFFISLDQEPFEEYDSRGTLLIEAIIETTLTEVGGSAFVQASGLPMAVAPGAPFACNLYFRNQSGEEIRTAEVTTTSDGGATVRKYDVTFDTPVAPYDCALIDYTLDAPQTEAESVEMTLSVTGLNGKEAGAGKKNSVRLYVSEDAFIRIPLVEEFTGLSCVNCPFMVYYLDKALEEYGPHYAYVAHHAGFQDDMLTLPEDKALLFLFGGPNTYNPAVMFDRRVLSGNNVPVISAKEASSEPYTLNILEAMTYPAKANVVVETGYESGKVSCRVHGKVAKAMLENIGNLRLTTYLVENGIKPEGSYKQNGVSANVPEGAPADMVTKFRHNGVIRVAYTGTLGDKIEADANGYFDVTYDEKSLKSDWAAKNCRVVAFVHKLNADEAYTHDNFVLNAGFQDLVAPSAVDGVEAEAGADVLYDLQGRRVSGAARGVVISGKGRKLVVK